jgi:hypothetical protein
MQFVRKNLRGAAVGYRWALALRYALRLGIYSLQWWHQKGRRLAARAALSTVLDERAPFDPQPV